MSESGHPSGRDPVRIVYHAENRTFARVFNERSLEEVKNVVRQKLGLGPKTDVSLKQMGSDALLDLEDDGDFQAFCVFLRSSVSVDIQVTVDRSQGSTAPLPVAPQLQEPQSASKPTVTSPSLSGEPAGVAASGEPTVLPKVVHTTLVSVKPGIRSMTRKRKVSFDNVGSASDEPTEQHPPVQPSTVTPVASAKTTESPAAPKPVGADEPAKKKRKKESTKTKDVHATQAVESPATKISAPKPKQKKSALDEIGTSTPKDAEAAQPPVKKPKKLKKDDSTVSKKSSASVDQDDMDRPISQPSNPVSEASLQPVAEKRTGLTVEGSISKTRQSERTKAPKGTACAAIPQTSASTSVQSEVAAAILSGYLSKASETIPPEPPAKRKSVRRVTRKITASSALPAISTTVLDAPANEVPDVHPEHRLEKVGLTNEPSRQTPETNSPPCPICLEEPFHIRYYCPTVLKGPDAVRERLEELKRTDMFGQHSLIKQLEDLLRDPKVTFEPSLDTAPTNSTQSRKVSLPSVAPLHRIPNIPNSSYLSEVTVESKDEGSSDSSDDMSGGEVKHQGLSAHRGEEAPDRQPLPSNDVLEAIIRGPASKQRSILHIVDRIVRDEGKEPSDSEEDEVQLEEDPDEEPGRSGHQLSTRSSDSESEEESRSLSPLRSVEDTLNKPGLGVQSSNKLAEHQNGDIVMGDSVDPPVLEGQDSESSVETHVGSENHIVVDESIGEKGVAIPAEEQPSSPVPRASVLQPQDAPSNMPQESANTEAEPTLDQDGTVSVVLETLNDPIEPADDLAPLIVSHSSNTDPIDASSEDIGSSFASATQSTPKPGVSKRIKTRSGQVLDDEADRPILLEQLVPVHTEVTPIPTKGKSQKKATETPVSQQAASTRRSPRFNSLAPSTSTPAAIVLLNHRSKSGARSGRVTKTPAKRSEECLDTLKSSAKHDAAQNGLFIAPTPSLNRWETLAEPSSPSVQLDEPLALVDELMSSSPQSDDNSVRGRANDECVCPPHNFVTPIQTEIERKERLFDLSSSQIPFPYSQKQADSAPSAIPDGKESGGCTDSEDEPLLVRKMTRIPVRYRPLSQLATEAIFSPSLPTPTNKSVTNGKGKKRVADEDSSSSSSSDEDEAGGSEHIPKGRRAGSALEVKKRKSILSMVPV